MIQIIIAILSIFGIGGFYIADFDYIVCANPRLCIHEEGHRLDYQLGLPSRTEEFKNTVDEILPSLIKNTTCIIETEECLYKEAYARLWEMTEFNNYVMLKEFREFYGI